MNKWVISYRQSETLKKFAVIFVTGILVAISLNFF
ncbi:hypothetical protein A5880_000368 [Enterococcus sp. 4G2_DIV0659]